MPKRIRSGSIRSRAAVVLVSAGCGLALGALPSRGAAQATAVPGSTNTNRANVPSAPAEVRGRANGTALLRALGPHAAANLAPNTGLVGALVELPKGARAEDFGLDAVAPGIGRMRASASRVQAFGEAHPDLRLEVAPPLHPLMDRVADWVLSATARRDKNLDGKGVMVGVADTGLDVTHPEMIDETGHSRVAWMLDLSLQPVGLHPELEQKFGLKDDTGKLTGGAVLARADIDKLLEDLKSGACTESATHTCTPTDEVGHGTHVTGIAAARGATGKYPGVAPAADIVFVRVMRSKSEAIENDDLVRAVQFMFDRADADHRPMVVNLSLGSDFGPHDGTFLWEQATASHVGPDKPGHAIVAAAGNSGSIVENPIHQSVRVTKGARMRVPVATEGAESGAVQIWVTLRRGADLKIGLDGPDGEWIAPVSEGKQNGRNTSDYNAGVIYGSGLEGSPIPQGSRGAIVVWTNRWPKGNYYVTFEGEGMAELYLQGIGDAGLAGSRPAVFAAGVREGTINLPATHPSIIGVGCTVNRTKWTSIGGAEINLKAPLLDTQGGLPARIGGATTRDITEGEVCWFSSAGPTAAGVPKPEIAAPGALVISAMSRGAKPGTPGSVFTNPICPSKNGKSDERCLQIDDTHGIAVGTSMSSPVVAGVVALLLEADPTLTQDKILALLQAGAHKFRGASPWEGQAGPGEVDAMGSLAALELMREPKAFMPVADQSWITLSSEYVPADGSTPVTAIVELRTPESRDADLFDATRLRAAVTVDDTPVETQPAIQRRGPGVWVYEWTPPAGLGGSRVSFGATFDGAPIVAARTVPIGADRWTALYPSYAKGSACAAAPSSRASTGVGGYGLPFAMLSLLGLAAGRRARTRARQG